ncbi:MAG: ABC transporter substrate-binding protein [Acidimicrobiales bacterium]
MKRGAGLRLVIALALGAVLLAACGGGSGPSGSSSTSATGGSGGGTSVASGAPIKVGFELELSGAFAANGKQIQDGWYLGLHDFGSSVDGHKIVAKFADEQGDPTIALNDAKRFVAQHVALLEGPTASNAAAAVARYAGAAGMPVDDVSLCSSQQLDAYQRYGLAYASAWTCDQPSFAAAQWAYQQGYRHVTTIGMDYSFGWQAVGTFIAAFEKAGGTIDKQIWAPISTVDFSSYVSQVPKTTNAVFALTAGADSTKLTNAWGQFGLAGKIPLFGDTTLFDQSILPSESHKAVVGLKMAAQYCDGIDTPANKRFAKEVHATYGGYPGYYTDTGYIKAERLVAALKKLHGNVSNRRALADALKSVSIQAPTGTISLSTVTDSPIQNIYICEVKDVKGALRNIPIKKYPSVQPWGTLGKSAWESIFRRDSAGRP